MRTLLDGVRFAIGPRMLPPRLLLAIAVIAPAIAPSVAHANQCDAGRALLSNREIPLGCPIRAYVLPGTADVKIMVGTTDVTGTVTPLGAIDLPIHYDEPDVTNECNPKTHVDPYTYDAYELTFTAAVGQTMEIGGAPYRTATVVEAGPCPAPEEYLNGSNWIQCSATVQEYQACHDQLCTLFASPTSGCEPAGSDDHWGSNDTEADSGCATSNGASAGALGGPIGLLVIAFARYRRRHR